MEQRNKDGGTQGIERALGNGSKPAGKGPQGRLKAKERPSRHVKEELSLARTRASGGEGMASRGDSKLKTEEGRNMRSCETAHDWVCWGEKCKGEG